LKHSVFIVGLGQIGMEYDYAKPIGSQPFFSHSSVFESHPHFRLVGATDVIKLQRERFEQKFSVETYTSVAKGVEITKPDIIIISTPANQRLELLKEIFTIFPPKLILIEKPLALDEIEALEIKKICERENVKLYVNYMRRLHPSAVKIKEMIAEGDIKPEFKGVVFYSKGFKTNATHFINLLQFWFGCVESIEVFNNSHPCRNNDDFVRDVSVSFKTGKVNFISINNSNFINHEISIFAENGAIRYLNNGEDIAWQGVEKNINFSNLRLSLNAVTLTETQTDLMWLVAENIRSVLSNKKSYLCSAPHALDTVKIVDQIETKL
jgi:predicted dehydrogenase